MQHHRSDDESVANPYGVARLLRLVIAPRLVGQQDGEE